MKGWKHDDLAADLAAHMRNTGDRVVWENMQLGPAGSPRPDCYTIPKSYTRFTPLAYEVKISVADFRADVTVGKWQSYLAFAAGVIFAVPQGLIGKTDVPAGCGLMVRTEEGWRNVKGPTLARFDTMPRDAWLKLLIDGLNRVGKQPEPRTLNTWGVQKKIRERYGHEIGDALSERDSAVARLQYQQQRAERVAQEAERERASIIRMATESAERDAARLRVATGELCSVLGLPEDASPHRIATAAREAAKRLDRDEEVARLRGLIERVRCAVEDGSKPMPEIARAA